jgi:hypothetical protein
MPRCWECNEETDGLLMGAACCPTCQKVIDMDMLWLRGAASDAVVPTDVDARLRRVFEKMELMTQKLEERLRLGREAKEHEEPPIQEKRLSHEACVSHVIRYRVKSHHIGFTIWHAVVTEDGTLLNVDEAADVHPAYEANHEDALPFIIGRLKWDGCVDIDFPDIQNCQLHFCGPEADPELGFLMREIYALGPEMESWDFQEEVTDDSIEEDFGKCYALAQKVASRNPEAEGVWVGTVSERLTKCFDLMVAEIEVLKDKAKCQR